jgi:hypothetical protein
MSDDADRTASLLTPAKLAQMKHKAAPSPAAWLDQMAADAGHANLRRLGELCRQLESQARDRDASGLAAALQAGAAALPQLDFALLQQNKGLFARFTGKGKSAGAEFNAQFDRVLTAAEAIRLQAQAGAKQHAADAAATERALMEFEVEFRGIEKIIDQGARWLQDMRNQLKARQQAAAGDEALLQQVRVDAGRCEILVARLKSLRAASSGAQQAHQLARAAAARRASLLQLQQTVAADFKAWQARVAPIASAAGDGASPALGLDGPREVQRALQAHLAQAQADCAQLQSQEQALADSLSQLGAQLGTGTA